MRQQLREPAVEFDGGDAGTGFEQAQRQRAEARPDLEHLVARGHPCGAHDLADRVAVDDEVLPELLGGLQVEPLREIPDLGGTQKRHYPCHSGSPAPPDSGCGSNGPGGGATGSSSQRP